MANNDHFLSVTLYNVTTMDTHHIEFFEKEQRKMHFNLYRLGLPADDPVYTLIKVLEDLNYDCLLKQSATKGRKGYNPIMMFALLVYAAMRGIRAVDRIVELCGRDLAFIWLTKVQNPQRDAFYRFKNDKLTETVLDDLYYQFLRRSQEEGLVTLGSLFQDGTKLEANANRYTFVWRGSINYHLAGLLDKIDPLYTRDNKLIEENGYDKTYRLAQARMFIIEGMDRVREVIEKNRQNKMSKKKKDPNNTIIEIDSCSPLESLGLQANLVTIANGEGIWFAHGKGQHKSDIHATFMRMKDDHMMNGQLKPAYNVQIAVENYFIIHSYPSNDRTDYDTSLPVLQKHKDVFGNYPKNVTADIGYSSKKNLVFLRDNHIKSYIKLQSHEKRKTMSISI